MAGTDRDTGAGAKTPRERYRAQVRAEIKERAWEQIATAGASALSLNAIAKQMGMSGPALYRYFAGRDELITELIRDAYRSLADTFRAVSASAPGAGLAELARALRGWALEDPQRYFLIYGTPVPGYHAPDDITAIAGENMAMLLDAAAAPAPESPATSTETSTATSATTALDTDLEGLGRQWADGHPAPAAHLHRALAFWTRLHGILSLELAGHFNGMGFDPGLLYAAELDDLLAH
ncbi:TetR/AcrR family transcriptional regulator [Streptomyces sp. KM273126]|uniref:TetR/AcrR family transcriptional regulator n=1 Tax=Streptomyces sp. KM273126 TaxID=2545247 RepID=UPI0010397EE6|nr:TetR/AcrR family transcriptional regulator [Streptomyces sp. KM273126]MBA2807718.1 TetR/AcrR family transcriptional regulator [Streptomyces sp. KM273126]